MLEKFYSICITLFLWVIFIFLILGYGFNVYHLTTSQYPVELMIRSIGVVFPPAGAILGWMSF